MDDSPYEDKLTAGLNLRGLLMERCILARLQRELEKLHILK